MNSAASPSRSTASTCKVLVAEDEVLMRLALADELRQSGFQVFEASDAEEAISILRSMPVDVVVTDMHMRTASDGLQVAAYVHAHCPGVGLLLSSAHAVPIPECDSFDALFVKPTNPQQIAAWIKRRHQTSLDEEDSGVA
jgi:CheY-like chemotaxis protein